MSPVDALAAVLDDARAGAPEDEIVARIMRAMNCDRVTARMQYKPAMGMPREEWDDVIEPSTFPPHWP
jgi:hypothetical protein